MDIMLHVGQNGQIALTCDGVFDSLIEAIELHYQSSQLAIKFTDVKEPVMMNCPLDVETLDDLIDQKVCSIGFFLGRNLAGAVYVPFNVQFYSTDSDDAMQERVLQ